jgi:hypothetical protein
MGLHPNCKMHLNESTKVDVEYNLPTGVLKTRVDMTERSIPRVDLRVRHVFTTCSPRVPDNVCTIIIIIPIIIIINREPHTGGTHT